MTDNRTTPPFRADHVGSLLRPPELLSAREDHAAGRIDDDELRAIEDNAIRDAVTLQKDAGLRSATDGEFRRATWHMDFIYQLGGIGTAEGGTKVQFRNEQGTVEWTPAALRVTEKIHLGHTIFADAFEFLKSRGERGHSRLDDPVPEHGPLPRGPGGGRRAIYPDMEEFWGDLCAAYADELRALGELGCTYLQFDDTSLAYLNDPRQREQIRERGTSDVERLHEQYVRNINRALEGKPDGMTVTTHLCRGNFRSSWAAEGGYDFVAEALFGGLGVDGFFLEYDDPRSGGFEPLRFVPKGKYVVLGLVTTKHGELESKDVLKRRIEEAAQYVPIEQLCLSPQCGFSSTVEGNVLTREQEIAKLELIVETAAEVWGN